MASKRKQKQGLRVINPDCAGIDIGGSSHWVAIDPERDDKPVREFEAHTDGLEAMADWLIQRGILQVAMEATGVYWIPVYELLERRGLVVSLVDTRATRQVSGRKSDVLDCQWIWQLMSCGLLRGAFRPPDDVCVLRVYVRQRARLVADAARAVQHMQKALVQMNVHLGTVVSDLTGKTGMAIVRAIVSGERDGAKLATLRDRRLKADEAALARSLRGNWRDEHLYALELALSHYDFLSGQISDCEARILGVAAPLCKTCTVPSRPSKPLRGGRRTAAQSEALRVCLQRILGVDLTAIPTIALETALVVCSELGPDLSKFPDCQHFCSWLQLAPGTRISGGKPLGGKVPKRTNRVGQALRQAAANARNSDSFIGAAHRARLARMDKPSAIKATAHHLARLIYALMTRGEDYIEHGVAQFEATHRDRQVVALHRKAKRLGFQLIEDKAKTGS